MSTRVSRARAVIATGRKPTVVAKVAGISRQALYRPISRRPASAGPGRARPGDEAIVEVAKANPTDGTRMVAALAARELGEPVNRKRVQRVMREHRLLQRSRNTDRRRRPGFFRVTRPDELWHIDMTKVWTAAHGWVYLHVAIDCCTREIACWRLDLRTRAEEAIGCVEAGLLARAVPPRRLTLGSDNGSQFTSRDFRKHLSARGVTHRRGGYRDPESQAFIESWFGQWGVSRHRNDLSGWRRLVSKAASGDHRCRRRGPVAGRGGSCLRCLAGVGQPAGGPLPGRGRGRVRAALAPASQLADRHAGADGAADRRAAQAS